VWGRVLRGSTAEALWGHFLGLVAKASWAWDTITVGDVSTDPTHVPI